jgi:hypothetical protein
MCHYPKDPLKETKLVTSFEMYVLYYIDTNCTTLKLVRRGASRRGAFEKLQAHGGNIVNFFEIEMVVKEKASADFLSNISIYTRLIKNTNIEYRIPKVVGADGSTSTSCYFYLVVEVQYLRLDITLPCFF